MTEEEKPHLRLVAENTGKFQAGTSEQPEP
jgi:hypothetical protein